MRRRRPRHSENRLHFGAQVFGKFYDNRIIPADGKTLFCISNFANGGFFSPHSATDNGDNAAKIPPAATDFINVFCPSPKKLNPRQNLRKQIKSAKFNQKQQDARMRNYNAKSAYRPKVVLAYIESGRSKPFLDGRTSSPHSVFAPAIFPKYCSSIFAAIIDDASIE